MRRLTLGALLACGAIFGAARPARADCLIEAVESCDSDFGGASNYYTIAIRGWCYMIRAGMCVVLDDR